MVSRPLGLSLVVCCSMASSRRSYQRSYFSRSTLRSHRPIYVRYRHVEQQLQEKKMRLMSKKPEIQKCLDAINLLVDKREEDEDVEVDFPLADQVYARARVHKDSGYVGLWLGAGVMVEYGLEEAKGLLEEQLVSCEQQLTEVDEDWGYVADQTTTTQVTLARLYNHSVELARR